MIRLAMAGIAHPHAHYVLDELAYQSEVHLVAAANVEPGTIGHRTLPASTTVYENHRQMLDQHYVDVVVVCGIYSQRADMIVDALASDADVLADKPLCTELEDLDRIQQAAVNSRRVVSTMFEKRAHPVTLATRKVVDDGELGQIALVAATGPHKLNYATRPEWFFDGEKYGGILADLAVHDIDLVLLFTGIRNGVVSGHQSNLALPQHPGFSDAGAAFFTSNNVASTLEAHWMWPAASPFHGHYRMRLTGTRGTAELDWAQNRLDLVTNERASHSVDLPAGKRPAENFFTAMTSGTAPEVGTTERLSATRLALLAPYRADTGGAPQHCQLTY